jgi:tripartite motif-containing protein 71
VRTTYRLVLVGVLVGVACAVWAVSSSGGSVGAGGIAAVSGEVLGGYGGLGDPMGSLLVSGSEPFPSGVAYPVGLSAGRWAGVRSAAEKARSRTAFSHLDAAQAARVAREAFPEQVSQRVGGPPSLAAGERIVRFVSERAAQIALPHGRHGVVESSQPMAVESSRGRYAPVDLGLARVGGVFESVRPLVGVVIPARLSEGVQLPEAGVSLTATDSKGASLGGAEGTIDGASVLYANTQRDVDTLVKPTPSGVEASTLLRAADSPSSVYFRVGLPAGARLVQSKPDVGPVRVMEGSRTVAVVRPPGAVDAAGGTVPVSMRVSGGDLLRVSVAAQDGDYQWPIEVDPEIAYDEAFGGYQCHQKGEAERQSSNWCWSASGNFKAHWYTTAVEMWNEGSVGAGGYTVMSYKTQGESKIYEVEGYTDGQATKSEAKVEFARKRGAESGELEVPAFQIVRNGYKSFANNQFCVSSGCPDTAGSNENLVAYKVEAYEPLGETYNIDFSVQSPKVYIAQEKGPEASLNTTEEHPQSDSSRVNIAYTHGWLSPSSGAFEYIIHDPGIGVSEAGVQEMRGGNVHLKVPIYEEGKCNGVQCNETYRSAVTYSPEMADGEDDFELWGRDKAGLFGYAESEKSTLIKVDGTKPYKLGFTGMPEYGAEISAAPHTLTVHATDGTEPVKSSGVKSISVSIDGGLETAVSGASCPEGPCTASGTYTLAGEALSEGVHRLVVTATDNAGNVAAREFTFDVRHGTLIPVGPGAVDPTTGQLKLSATDVSLAGAGGVSRVFQSRDLSAGAGGPLGSQWALSLGGGEGITVLPDGSVVLASSAGGTTTFARNEKGEFESPPGDENIKVESKEKEPGKGISEYLLKDSNAGTTTVFSQPVGSGKTMPVYANQFGQEGAGVKSPVSEATDAQGNVWVTDYGNDRILEFSAAGVLLHAYGSPGVGPGSFSDPWGIAVNRSTGNVYVSDPGNNRLVELSSSGSFVRAFGWGVSPGGTRKDEFQNCTSYCEAGIVGSGEGQFNWPQGVAVDSSGNVWVAEYNNDRLQEFGAEGKYLHSYGTAGSGGGQFNRPANIVFSGSDLFVTDQENNRLQELSNAGAFVEAIGWGVSNGEEKLEVCTSGCRAGSAGSGNGQLSSPIGLAIDAAGNLYVGEYINDRVQELSSAGAFVTKFGSAGSGNGEFLQAMGVAVGSSGGLYVADNKNNRLQEWMRPSWLPARTEGALENVSTAYAYEAVSVEGKVVVEPTEALAATPAGIKCVGEHGEVEVQYLQKGCRALTFNYATTSTATGEKPGEWGDHVGDLTRVYLHAWESTSGTMKATEVAHYLYDSKGRLRAEWDPRIEPEREKCVKEPLAHGCLTTAYGYDEEGHVAAVTSSGRESWALTYGTIPGDPNTGRLLKVHQGSASSALWNGELLKNTTIPAISGTPVVGIRLAVSNGTWSGGALAYAYQWEDCSTAGTECTPIRGASNANYTPVRGDAGHTIRVEVTAINGGGAVGALTGASGEVQIQGANAEYSLGAESRPCCGIASGPDGNLWLTAQGTNTIDKVTTKGEVTEYHLPAKSEPSFVIVGPDENLWFTDHGTSKIGKITTGGTVTEYALPEKSYPEGIAKGPDGDVWFTATGTNKIGKITTTGKITEYSVPSLPEPGSIVAGPERNVWFTAYAVSKIVAMTTEGAIVHEYSAPFGSGIGGITEGPDGNLWFQDYNTNKIGKITTLGTLSEYSLPAGSRPTMITPEPSGNLWVAETETSKLGKITTKGTITEYSLPSGSGPHAITAGSDGNLWYADAWTSKVGKFNPYPYTGPTPSEGALQSPQPGSTIEYRVPVSGGGVPQNLSKEEVEKWGQKKDYPAEGTAIFPPDEPQGWPASGYKRATIDYMDEQGRTVNAVAPGGAIATTEYNETNEVTRTLTPDNRATAMAEGCVSVSKKECKSAETAEKLDTRTEYSEENSQVSRVLDPEHKVKLSSGSEVQARAVTHDYYNEGAEEAEKKNKEEYSLLTKSITGALLPNGEEKDARTTLTSYSGQNYLGWKLREPTSTIVDPQGLDLVHQTTYDPTTGNVLETRAPEGSSERVYPPIASFVFGSEGTGNGQFKSPSAVAVDASGDAWVLDKENGRVEKFTESGTFLAAYGSKGAGSDQFSAPMGVAVNTATGNVYVVDTGNNRIEELNASGAFVAVMGWGVSNGNTEYETCTSSCRAGIGGSGAGQFKEPAGIAVDASGDVWVSDTGNNRVQELSASGEFIQAFGSYGHGEGQFKGPEGIALSGGEIYVADLENKRVEEFSPAGQFLMQFGVAGTGVGQFQAPWGIAAAPVTGDLYVVDDYESRVLQFSPAGKFLAEFGTWGTAKDKFEAPTGIAVNASGTIYVADKHNNRVAVWQPPGAGGALMNFLRDFGSEGWHEGQFYYPKADAIDGNGNVWVTDSGNDRIEEFSSHGAFVTHYGSEGTGNLQFKGPYGIAINQSTGNIYVADSGNNRIQEISSSGTFIRSFGSYGSETGKLNHPDGLALDAEGNVWVADTANNRIQEFSASGVFIAAYGSKGSGEGQFSEPEGLTFSGSNVYVADSANNRIEELSSKGAYINQFGSAGKGSGEFSTPAAIAADPAGNLYVTDNGNGRVEEFASNGKFLASFAASGSAERQLKWPEGIAIDSAGDMYVADAGNDRIQEWMPERQAAHDTKTTYYTAAANTEHKECGEHPEWANLSCRMEPAAQPADSSEGKPNLPVVTMTYNMWDEVQTTTETFGTVTRTKTQAYDAAGRALTSEETSAVEAALPKVTNEYNTETGALEKQSATIKGETKTIAAKQNTLGQLVEYTDGTGNVAKYAYEEGGDGRLLEVSEGKGEEAKSSQGYSYDPTTGFMTTLVDTGVGTTGAGTFTASYDLEGKMISEVYPNGMCANTTYDPTGTATSISYIKTRNCSESKPTVWMTDSIVPGIHGETLSQTSSLASESYAYDNAGRLLETQETPAGKGCTTRLYAYDEESNRTSLTTRAPGSEGKCATEGGTIQAHSYDEANRLVDQSVEYETFGNTTRLPAADAGEHEIKSTYYVDNQIATQEQNKTLDTYIYDPAGRTMETTSENTETKAKSTIFSHYAGSGGTPTWTSEGAEKWARDIPGIGGSLQATAEPGKTPVLQLSDLQGNIIATAADNETETKLLSTYNSTEFGVPTEGKTPPKYAWLGATGLATETSFGAGTSTQGGASYVPQVARDLQTAPVIPPGAFPNGQGSGEQYGSEIPGWYTSLSGEESANTLAEWNAKQEQLKKEAEENACQADPESCSEDPAWSGDISLSAASAITGAISGIEVAYELGGGKLALKVALILAKYLKVDFVTQIKEAIQRGVFGYSVDDVAQWMFKISALLETCVEVAENEGYKHAHCWLYLPTVIRHRRRGGPGFEIPDFTAPIGWNNPKDVAVGLCPYGVYSQCYNVHAF